MTILESLLIPADSSTYALQVAIGGAGVCAVVLVIARLARRRPEPLRYAILLAGVLVLLAVPALVGLGRVCQDALAGLAPLPEETVLKFPAEMLPAMLEQAPAEPAAAEPAESSPALGDAVAAALVALWALGTFIGLCRLLRSCMKLRRAPVGSPWSTGFWTDELRERLARKLGLRRFPQVSQSSAVPMPMVVGAWRPRIVLPDPAPASWTQREWEAVLLHEAAHIARGDPWAILAQRVAAILFWWCPLVYVLARRMSELRENICDDLAVQGACDRITYAQVLIDSAEHFLTLTAIPVPLGLLDSARSGLETRVSRLLKEERPAMARLSLTGKLLGAALLIAACLLTTGGTALSGGQSPPPRKVQIKIIVDGKEIDLNDPALLEIIAATQRKAAQEEATRALRVIAEVKATQPKVAEVTFTPDGKVLAAGPDKKALAFSPDGKVIAMSEGGYLLLMDSKTGKIMAKYEQPKYNQSPYTPAQTGKAQPDANFYYQLLPAQPWQAKPDPRIEELVKQAEAIKPGSGAAIRKALQAAPKAGEPVKEPPAAKPVPALPTGAPPLGVRFWDDKGTKKVIVLEIEGGKVVQLNEEDMRKLLEKHMRLLQDEKTLHLRITDPAAKEKATEAWRYIEKFKTTPDLPATKKAAPVQPPLTTAPDLEALSRQLERLNAELEELRKRVGGGGKK